MSLPGRSRPSGLRERATELRGRDRECALLDQLLDAVREGAGRALVVRGDPGVGKTALLEYLAERALGCRVARIAGVQSEMELAYAGLHQLCAPMLGRLERLPGYSVVAPANPLRGVAAGTDVVRSMAQRAGAEIVEVDASHVVMVSQPQAVTERILKALHAVS